MASLPVETVREDFEARAEAFAAAIVETSSVTTALVRAGYSPESGFEVLDSPGMKAALEAELRRRLLVASFLAADALQKVVVDGKNSSDRVAAAKAIRDWSGLGVQRGAGGQAKDLTEMDSGELAAMVNKAQDLLSARAKPVVQVDSAPVARQSKKKLSKLLD